LFVF
jgi:hypothetical protein